MCESVCVCVCGHKFNLVVAKHGRNKMRNKINSNYKMNFIYMHENSAGHVAINYGCANQLNQVTEAPH